MAECAVDGRPTDLRLCPGCVDHLKSELRTVPWLVKQLGITLTRQARVGQRNGPRGRETPLPYHLGASVDLESLRDGLAMWCDAVARQRGIAVDEPREAVALSRWLLRWAGEVAQHEDAGELHGDVLSLLLAARRTIDLAPVKHFLGPCDDCGRDLYCGTNATVITCHGEDCAATYQIAQRRAWLLEQAVDQLRTAAELSRELPWIGGLTINRKLINKWASRGYLQRYPAHPKDRRKAPRFRIGEVIEMARSAVTSSARKVVC